MGDPCVIFDETASLWKVWFNATRAKSFADDSSYQVIIKYAESRDGRRWDVQQEPVLVAGRGKGDWDYYSAETPDVVINRDAPPERRYVMLYSGSAEVTAEYGPNYRIGVAFSQDGKDFSRLSKTQSVDGREGMVVTPEMVLPEFRPIKQGVVADPDVVLREGVYHLWFSSYAVSAKNGKTTYGISYATSKDAIDWTPGPRNPIPELIGSNAPGVVWDDQNDVYRIWYSLDTPAETNKIPANGSFETLGFWQATSTNGSDWRADRRQRDYEWDPSSKVNLGIYFGPSPLYYRNKLYLFHVAWHRAKKPHRDLVIPLRTGAFVSGYSAIHLVTRDR
jgi:predicted GH43/DUF377 family glycosyl hydrolase